MLYIKYKKNNLNKNSFKIIVSLKVSKKAVTRNKIKRRIREILRDANLNQGYEIVVITNKNILDKSFQEIKKCVLSQLDLILSKKSAN